MARWSRSLTGDFLYESVLFILLWVQMDVSADKPGLVYWSNWSTWSSCTAECGYGISTRVRHCLRDNSHLHNFGTSKENSTACAGAMSQIKICSLEACPLEQPSFHVRSCSQYNSRTFSGRQYVWEPFIHPNDACKMSCRAKGISFYANLADKAEDGSPCKLGSSEAFCVKGVCKRVGCDRVVESAARKDVCGVCSGDGSSCRTITGIFTSTELKRGLNYVINIPAGSTSINITELQTSRNLLVLQYENGSSFINDGTSYPTSSVVKAAGTEFTYLAKSPSNPRDIIHSLGPTNTAIVLKLLLRGSNSGIFYTFSAPKDVSETVIQQIRHRSQPAELPPDAVADPRVRAANSIDTGQIITPATTSTTSSLVRSDLQLSADKQEQLTSNYEKGEYLFDTTPNPKEETFTFPVTEFNTSDSENVDDKDVESTSIGKTHILDEHQSSEGTTTDATSQDIHSDDLNGLWVIEKSSTVSEATDLEDQNGIKHHSDKSRIHSESIKPTDDASNNQFKEGHQNNIILDTITESSSLFSNRQSDASSDSVKVQFTTEVPGTAGYNKGLDEQRIHDSAGNQSVAETPQIVQSYGNSRKNQDSNKFNYNLDKKTNLREYGTSDSKKDDADRYEDRQLTAREWDDSVTSSGLKNSNYVTSVNFAITDNRQTVHTHVGTDFDRKASQGSSIRRQHERFHPEYERNITVYTLPRYSQSFAFGEKHKSNHTRKHPHRNSAQTRSQQNRQNHGHYHSGSQTIPNFTDTIRNQNIRHKANPDKLDNYPDSGYETSWEDQRRSGYSDRKESLSSVSKPSDSHRINQQIARDRHQTERDELVSREMRLRDRQTLLEERKRRMEEQRQQYNERLREYQEKLRQRQAEIEESRRRSAQASDVLGPDSWTDSNNHNRYSGNSPSLSQRSNTQQGQQPAARYSSTHHRQPSAQDRTEVRSRGYGWNTGRNINAIGYPDHNSVVQQSAYSSGFQGQDNQGRISGVHSQTDLSWRRNTGPQTSRRNDNSRDNIQVINRSWDGDRKSSRSDDRYQSPLVIQPPRQEQPESLGDDRSHPSRSWPRHHSSGPRYIPGPPSQTEAYSALSGPEKTSEVYSNQLLNNNRISTNQLTLSNQNGHGDFLANQISGNTLGTVHSSRNTIYEWRISGLTQCTHSCGGGVQQTVVVCVDPVTQAVVTDENCRHITKPKLLAVTCNTRPCSAEWSPGPWSSCSVSCGPGEQTRTVTCQARVSPTLNMTMPNSNCESQERIPIRQACKNNPCSTWRIGTWTNCSSYCGDGHRTRNVQCVDLQSNVVSDDACVELRPHSEEQCNLGECGKGWFFTDWPTDCPVECGSGEMTRRVFCVDDAWSSLPDSRCNISQRPAETQTCRVSRPCGGLWFTGPWSKCDVICGSGNSRRDVLCIKDLPGNVKAVVGPENCEGLAKPAETQPCQSRPCTSEWYMASWTQCSQSCGTGYRTREVKCLTKDQKPYDDCQLETRPKTREACNTKSCADVLLSTEEGDQECTDKFPQCSVVQKARLCQYAYYKTMCCRSCAEDT